VNHSEFSDFAKDRLLSITDNRVRQILWYVIECHFVFIGEKKQYSEEWVKEKTSYKFENFLKFRFVKDYLMRYKKRLREKTPELDKITFHCEPEEEYIDKNGIRRTDPIDIYINNVMVEVEEWNEENENIYFAIECKRIRKLSDARNYLKDTEDFAERDHTNLRLPFEGQMAFIENADLDHKKVADNINEKLKKSTTIQTLDMLTETKLHPSFPGSYRSKHKKNFNQQQAFSIYHLMFNYSGVVVE